MYHPRIGSLCSGYRGLDMAVEAVFGGTTAWVSDIDPGASAILAHHWPAVPNLGDLTAVDWGQVEPVDIVCGGYPCQPFSNAGLRRGVEDERHIWPDIARALGVLRPRLAIFENVAGHLRLGFDTVLADLAGLGFDVEWCVVRASEVGAPHQRKRLIVLATAQDADGAARGQRRLAAPGQAEAGRPRADVGGRGGAPAADAGRPGLALGSVEHHGSERQAAQRGRGEPPAHADGSRWGAGEQDLRTRQPDAEGRAPADATGNPGRLGDGDDVRAGCGPDGREPAARGSAPADAACLGWDERRPEPARVEGRLGAAGGGIPAWGQFTPAIRRWEHATGRPAPRAVDARNRLSPLFVEWLMGLPEGHVTAVPGLTRNQALHALGNGVVPQQATAALRLLAARACGAVAA